LELSVITAAVLGGIAITGGVGTLGGAVLSLILIGLMRFGMGLLNIQGQVQGIVIGSLLVLSILLPNLAQLLSTSRRRFNWQPVVGAAVLAVVFLLFIIYFFWSRAPLLAGA
jgi:rhamnose transport system permease protein